MLAPVGIDAIDPTFDAVPAHTAVVVIALQQAFAGIDNEETAPVELSRTARVREAQPTQGTGLFGETALTRAPREGDLGDEVVGAGQVVVAPRNHVFTFIRRARAVKRDADPEGQPPLVKRSWRVVGGRLIDWPASRGAERHGVV